MSTEAAAPSGKKHLVILVHGINTRATWMTEVSAALRRAGLIAANTSYGKYPVWTFALRLEKPERAAIEGLTARIREAIAIHKPDDVSVIAHSFGTYVFSKVLLEQKDLRWNRVIFCGSVVNEDFPFADVLQRFAHPLLNEVGGRDIWPAFAERLG